MQLSLKENLKIINKIEQEFPVETLKINNLKIWPIIRLSFTSQELRNAKGKKKAGKLNDIVSKFKIIFSELFYAFYDTTNTSISFSQSDIVFLLTTDKRNEKVQNKHFAKFADALVSIIDKMDVSKQVLEYSFDRMHKYPKYSKSAVVSYRLLPVFYTTKLYSLFASKKLTIDNWQAFVDYLEANQYTNKLKDKKYYIDRYFTIKRFEKKFMAILKKCQPKFIVFSGMHSVINFGLNLACKRLNVTSVEMQHGQQGRYHNMYTHWSNIPKDGYELLPARFWTWGQNNAININQWASHSNEHKAVIGGNTWMTFVKDSKIYASDSIKNQNGKIKVLISMQELEDVYDSPLKEAILKGGDNIEWYLRLHPAKLKSMDEVKLFFQDCNPDSINYEEANKLQIYELLSLMDFNITFWSTVAYEALAFDVPTILIHPNGRDAMNKYISEGIFRYANSAQEILSFLDKSCFQKEQIPFIETSSNMVREQVRQLLNVKN